MSTVGSPAKHVDWTSLTSGTAKYAADIVLPGELVAGVLRSPHPHARILEIDVSVARKLPGVHAVLTAGDVTGNFYLDYRAVDADRRILAVDKVRFVGEPVALVAADTADQAERALAAIRIKYKPLPVLDTVSEALASRASVIHSGAKDGNVAHTVSRRYASPAAPQAPTEHTVRSRYLSTRQSHVTMEPHTVIAHWQEEENCLHVWAPSQNPRLIHRDLAQLFNLAPEAVRMHELTVGGDFGGRTQTSGTEGLVCALSLATGRPVKLKQSRSEEFAFTKWRLSWDTFLELGCDSEGNVTGLSAAFDVDNGAYNQAGPGEMDYGSIALGSTYRWDTYSGDGRCVYTNKPSPSSFRGAGGYAVTWSLECAIDELAEKVGIDPIDFRLQNAVSEPAEKSITGWEIKSSGLKECLQAVRQEIDWDRKRAQGGNGRGVGVACAMHVTGLSRENMLTSAAAADVFPDGRVRIRSGCGDAGTGQKTLLCQAMAEVLGIELENVSILATDTAHTPHDAGAGASRGSFVSVSSVKKLAEEVREILVTTAAQKFHTSPEDIHWDEGQAEYSGDAIDIGTLAGLAAPGEESLTVESEFRGLARPADPNGYEDIAPTYSFAAHAVEVEVDQNTGAVRVIQVVAAHDSGTILNPNTARGQVEGGVVMGIGAVLGESLIFEEGRVVNPSYADYVVPRASDAPGIHTVFIETADMAGPFGAKGLGEIPLMAIGPAVTNAIHHATGVRLRQAPHTPDVVIKALRERDGLKQRAGALGTDIHRWWVEAIRRVYPLGLHKALKHLGPIIQPTPVAGRVRDLVRPESHAEILTELAAGNDRMPLAGGTDILALEGQRLPIKPVLVDLTLNRQLTGVTTTRDGTVHIGAAVTLAELAQNPAVGPALRQTAHAVATPQIRQVATVAGNLCQAKRCWFYRNGFDCYKRGGVTRPCYAVLGDHRFYHAVKDGHRCQAVTPSDLATTLIALDAVLEVDRRDGRRNVQAADLYRGPGEVTLRDDEIITKISVPPAALARSTVYRKFSLWHGGFAVLTVAVSAAQPLAGVGSDVRIVLGGVSPCPRREHALERILEGTAVNPEAVERCVAAWLESTHPLRDNHWKAFAAGNVLRAALNELFEVKVP
jgi:CO/xanthine dehydrogenase Mo-binding subunit/CO/xanthine dehydrogenase FAD-binding subunit